MSELKTRRCILNDSVTDVHKYNINCAADLAKLVNDYIQVQFILGQGIKMTLVHAKLDNFDHLNCWRIYRNQEFNGFCTANKSDSEESQNDFLA